ncbi:PepSY-associated TM helix domain-containing protein [Cardiobacterium hominis]|uniref:PepSY-associated TM helix domain-containing protein n=1 Tax=Cardiobacterium hominis TaxID=2718 RepID=UPI0028E1985F|nr:PepSY-associated TM helix domain-containing protein [Cardiobacterium hominis]
MKVASHLLKTHLPLHTWCGVVSALFLIVCFLAGALTLFLDDLNRWAAPPPPSVMPAPDARQQAQLLDYMAAHPEITTTFTLHLRTTADAPAPLSWERDGEQFWATRDANGQWRRFSAPLPALGEVLDDLHRTAGIPGAVGGYTMGVVAVLYALALISGTVLLLPRLKRQLFALRPEGGRRRAWLDLHNLLGLTALPFHLVIAITTAVFVFYAPLEQAMRALSPAADTDVAEAVGQGELLPPATLLARAQAFAPALQAERMVFDALDDRAEALVVVLGGTATGGRRLYVALNPYGGALRYRNSGGSFYHAASDAFAALHFGNYGGYPLRWLYFVLALAGAVLFYTGNLLWLGKRARGERRDVRLLAALTVGTSCGAICGMATMLLTARFQPLLPLAAETLAHASYYLPFLTANAYALRRGAGATAALLCVSIALLCAIPATTGLAAVGWLPFVPRLLLPVDATALLLALTLYPFARKAR